MHIVPIFSLLYIIHQRRPQDAHHECQNQGFGQIYVSQFLTTVSPPLRSCTGSVWNVTFPCSSPSKTFRHKFQVNAYKRNSSSKKGRNLWLKCSIKVPTYFRSYLGKLSLLKAQFGQKKGVQPLSKLPPLLLFRSLVTPNKEFSWLKYFVNW